MHACNAVEAGTREGRQAERTQWNLVVAMQRRCDCSTEQECGRGVSTRNLRAGCTEGCRLDAAHARGSCRMSLLGGGG